MASLRMHSTLVQIFGVLLVAMVTSGLKPDDKVYLLDIRINLILGATEMQLIRVARNVIWSLPDVHVIFEYKEIGNRNLITIISVNSDCAWSELTARLYRERINYITIPLYSCSMFAAELGINMSNLMTTSFNSATVQIARLAFDTTGYTTTKYFSMLRNHMEITKKMITEDGIRLNCFRILSNVPVKMIYFTDTTPSQSIKYMKSFRSPGRFEMIVRLAQDLGRYTQC